MDSGDVVVGGIVALLIGLFGLFIIDNFLYADAGREPCVVIQTTYHPSETHTGIGSDSRGRPVTTTSTSSEKWLAVVKTEHGAVVAASAMTVHDWAELRADKPAVLVTQKTRIFGMTRHKVSAR